MRAIDLMWDCQGKGSGYRMAQKLDPELTDVFGSFDLFACLNYGSGIADTMMLLNSYQRGGLFCFPKSGLTQEQQRLVVLKWMRDNPDALHESRRTAVIVAFAKAFPCEAQRPGAADKH